MPMINCYVDDETLSLLEKASAETGREIAELAEAAISNASIEFKVRQLGYGREAHDAKYRKAPRCMP